MLRADTIQITPEILSLIARIDEFKGAWRAGSLLPPDRLSPLRRVATVESIGASTRLEGSKLSDREVERALQEPHGKPPSGHDEQEVAGYAALLELILGSWEDIPFIEDQIKALHEILVRDSEADARQRGTYKTLPNTVAAFDENGARLGVVFQTATPFETPRLMTELIAWLQAQREAGELHPLLVIALGIVVFLEIHPFQNGNGRLSRALTTLLLLQAGYAYGPYSSLERVIEESRDAYYPALRATQRTIRAPTPDWQPWLIYFLRALAEQVRRLERKIERERQVLAPLPALSVQIVEFAREHGRVTIGEAIRLTGANRNTLKLHFRSLVERGQLSQRGGGRGAWYELR